jgi:uncharacterized protein YcbX
MTSIRKADPGSSSMTSPTTLASIHIYPVKSLGGFSVPDIRLTDRGLEHDRRWMLIDPDGRFLSQRECQAMACLHCAAHGNGFRVTDVRNGNTVDVPWSLQEAERVKAKVWDDDVDLMLGPAFMHQWFSETLQRPVRLAYMPDSTVRTTDPTYADVPVALNDGYPSLIISQASLDDLNARLGTPVRMDRFRPNFVITGGAPFQEDDWKTIIIGETHFNIVKPCARCVIITTDQRTGERSKEPLRTLATFRSVGNKVRFGMNATFAEMGTIHVGVPVQVNA